MIPSAKSIFLLLVVIFLSNMHANQDKTLLVLPFKQIGLDSITSQSVSSIFIHELRTTQQFNLLDTEPFEMVECYDLKCALAAGQNMNADYVVLGALTVLGEKIIVQYQLLNVQTQSLQLIDKAISKTVEDLDVVLKRVALSIAKMEPLSKTAEVGNIMARETDEPNRRNARKFTAFSFGYLYPQNGYDQENRSFSMDFRAGAEMEQFDFGMLLAARKGFAVNLFGNYLFTRTDICPYIGGAFGLHWVNHDHYYNTSYYGEFQEDKRKKDGPEITLNAGFRLFHTYNFKLLINFSYIHTFNDFDDRATLFTIGILK